MLTADIPLTEEERDLLMEQLRGFLDEASLTNFDSEHADQVAIAQSILEKLREAF